MRKLLFVCMVLSISTGAAAVEKATILGAWIYGWGPGFDLLIKESTILYGFDMKEHPYTLEGNVMTVDFGSQGGKRNYQISTNSNSEMLGLKDASLSPTSFGFSRAKQPQEKVPATNKSFILSLLRSPAYPFISARDFRFNPSDHYPFMVVDLYGKYAIVNIGGKEVKLDLINQKGVPSDIPGSNFEREFANNDIKVLVKYDVISHFLDEGLGCERTEYKIVITVKKGKKTETIQPESYGEGC